MKILNPLINTFLAATKHSIMKLDRCKSFGFPGAKTIIKCSDDALKSHLSVSYLSGMKRVIEPLKKTKGQDLHQSTLPGSSVIHAGSLQRIRQFDLIGRPGIRRVSRVEWL